MRKFRLTFSIWEIAASVSTRLQRKYNRWIRIENAYQIVYKYLKKEQKLKDLLRAQQFWGVPPMFHNFHASLGYNYKWMCLGLKCKLIEHIIVRFE
jgi:hypothetical protein